VENGSRKALYLGGKMWLPKLFGNRWIGNGCICDLRDQGGSWEAKVKRALASTKNWVGSGTTGLEGKKSAPGTRKDAGFIKP